MTTEIIFEDAEAPRGQTGSREPTPLGRFVEELQSIRAAVEALQRGSQLRNASISGGEGLRILDEDGTPQAQIAPDRTVTIFDQNGDPVVRMGDMQQTGPLEYGIEVRIGASWIQLGSQNVIWGNVGSKPGTYDEGTQRWDPRPHQHGGGDIQGNVAGANYANSAGSANSAGTANWASLSDGSQHGFNNTVMGTQFYAVWVGNDGGFHFGRNTSSRKYKFNIRKHEEVDKGVLGIELTTFDRKDQYQGPAEGIGPARKVEGSRGEFGAIAEQAAEVYPRVVQYFDGKVDGIRYEMIGLGLVPVVREHEGRIAELEKQQAEDRTLILEMRQQLDQLTGRGDTEPPAATTKGTTK